MSFLVTDTIQKSNRKIVKIEAKIDTHIAHITYIVHKRSNLWKRELREINNCQR
jgi:hypothetical protein